MTMASTASSSLNEPAVQAISTDSTLHVPHEMWFHFLQGIGNEVTPVKFKQCAEND